MENLIDEKKYLNGDTELLNFFEEKRKIYNRKRDYSLKKYEDVIKYYEIYLDCIVEELLKYDFNNALDYSIALGHLIKKGYLSDNLDFKCGVNTQEILGKLGASILLGSGCCRNVCDMHKDVFNKLNIDIIPFYCFQGKTRFVRAKNKEANHIINLVKYNDNIYGIDVYNNCLLYKFINPFIMKSISSIVDARIRYKPYYEIILDGKDLNSIKERLKEFEDYSKLKSISSCEYELGLRYDVEKIMYENEDKLLDFHDKTKLLRKNIISRWNKDI